MPQVYRMIDGRETLLRRGLTSERLLWWLHRVSGVALVGLLLLGLATSAAAGLTGWTWLNSAVLGGAWLLAPPLLGVWLLSGLREVLVELLGTRWDRLVSTLLCAGFVAGALGGLLGLLAGR